MTSLKIADLQRDAREEGISIGMERGLVAGREEGISIGVYENKLETARSLLKDGFPPEMISKYTSLSIDVIEGLTKN